jgi:hypothetical protein
MVDEAPWLQLKHVMIRSYKGRGRDITLNTIQHSEGGGGDRGSQIKF